MLNRRSYISMAVMSLMAISAQMYADVSVTVYNDNFAVVRESRDIQFDEGLNTLKYTDVASSIDPTSVSFKCLDSSGGVSILEQNYEYDLVNADSLLKRYIDKDVMVLVKGSGSKGGSMLRGKLAASVGNDLILEQKSGEMVIISRNSVESISLESGPKDLVTKPTLVWLADAETSGSKQCEVTYTTSNLRWNADYTAILNEDDTKLAFSGWVTVDNQSGASYENANIKLIAGDVRRQVQPRVMFDSLEAMPMRKSAGVARDFEEKTFMEYHMYTLGRKSTIANNQTKQIEFVERIENIPVKKEFVYETSDSYSRNSNNDKVQIKIIFDNKDVSGLGMALPKGKVRTFKADPADGSLEFVGEDSIDHTPKDEEISLYIGNAFDLVVEDVITDQKNGNSWRTIKKELTLKNRKDQNVTINVDQKISRYSDWEIDDSFIDGKSINYNKIDAEKLRFEVPVKAGKEVKLTFTYTQRW